MDSIKRRWTTAVSLSEHFNPSKVIRPEHIKAIVTGDYPKLREIGEAYGDSTAAQVVVYAIVTNIVENAGGKEMLTQSQTASLANTIYAEYPWMKISELLLFAQKFKAGHYGRFYGAQDPTVISEALKKFWNGYRNDVYAEAEREAAIRKAEQEAHNPNAITYQQFLEKHKGEGLDLEGI